jgi:antirestriction protein ArdC
MGQRPDASMVAGFKTWQSLDRYVMKGEHGLTVLAPVTRKVAEEPARDGFSSPEIQSTTPRTIVTFRPATVFDISQTDGKPLDLPQAHEIVGDHLKDVLDALTQHVVPAPVTFQHLDPERDGYGMWEPTKGTITITTQSDPNHQLKTLLHEWAHSIGVPAGSPVQGIHRGTEEVAAETSAYVMSKMIGLDTKDYSQAYVAGWAGMTPDKVKAVMSDVSHRVRVMSEHIEHSPDPLLQRLTATWNPTQRQLQEVER